MRVDLLASRRAGRVGAAARLLTAAAASACAVALLLAPSPLRAAAALASAAAFTLAFRPRRATPAQQLVIGRDGAIQAYCGDDAESASVRYFGPRFVCLQTPRGALALWPDSMAAADWRRLLVACRWQRPPGVDGQGGGRVAN